MYRLFIIIVLYVTILNSNNKIVKTGASGIYKVEKGFDFFNCKNWRSLFSPVLFGFRQSTAYTAGDWAVLLEMV